MIVTPAEQNLQQSKKKLGCLQHPLRCKADMNYYVVQSNDVSSYES